MNAMEAIPGPVAEAVERRLSESGVRQRGGLFGLTSSHPTSLVLDIDGRAVHVAALYLPDMSAGAALRAVHVAEPDVPVFIVGRRIHASSAETMRAKGIWYADEAGNAYLRGDGLVVDVRGRRTAESMALTRQGKSGPSNPFTPKRAQVVFALLSDPAVVDAPLREIAEKSGVSLGMAKDTVDALELIGFVEDLGSRRRLVRTDDLLDLWAAAYPSGLGRANRIVAARGDIAHWGAPEGVETAVSGESALRGLIQNPESLVLYVASSGDDQILRDLMVQNRWHSDGEGNVIVRKLFWRNIHPDNDDGNAPAALVYADLLASNEPRQIEMARHMRNTDERLLHL